MFFRFKSRASEAKTLVTTDEAKEVAKKLDIDFSKEKFDLFQFVQGMNVKLEHGKKSPKTNVTNDDLVLTGKIALAHLNEFPDYYVVFILKNIKIY